ncbi:hypothetical protein ACK3YQ_01615 [Aeromonas caviae]
MLQTDVQWDKNNITVLGFASLNPTYAKPYLLNGLYRSRLVGDKRQRLPVKVIRLLHVAGLATFFDVFLRATGVTGYRLEH